MCKYEPLILIDYLVSSSHRSSIRKFCSGNLMSNVCIISQSLLVSHQTKIGIRSRSRKVGLYNGCLVWVKRTPFILHCIKNEVNFKSGAFQFKSKITTLNKKACFLIESVSLMFKSLELSVQITCSY